jgi:DNA (cytosine-5)-methyltransferase 1
MEGLGYAFGCVPFPAASVGAPHIRDRAYWVAHPANPNDPRLEGWRALPECSAQFVARQGRVDGGLADATGSGLAGASGSGEAQELGIAERRVLSAWVDAQWLQCSDGKWRCVEPGAFPLADGLPARVGRLRGYGNAIVPQQAAEFIAAAAEALTHVA